MTVKTSVSLTDRHHQFANKKFNEGVYTSVSGAVAAGIELIMQDEMEREAALTAMQSTIKRRMKTPQSEWIELNNNDKLFEKARARLQSKQP